MSDLPFTNYTFVFTGEMSMPRDTAKSKVIALGGRVTTALSTKTTYLITGTEPGPKKLEKAAFLKIKIIDENGFLSMLEPYNNLNDTFEVNIKRAKTNENDVHKEINDNKLNDNVKSNNINDDKIDISSNNKASSAEIEESMWTEKYRPKCKQDLVGNQAAYDLLELYLKGKAASRCALLSGQPGIGKTTLAHLLASILNFDIIEFNASDTRNKNAIINNTKALNFMALTVDGESRKKVVIMDEIDGMTSDRGGLPELAKVIKQSRVHIICICNDRNNQKIRTLANNAVDVRFRKPTSIQIKPRLNFILKAEGKQMRDSFLSEIVNNSNGDIRYCINTMQNLLLRETLSHNQLKTLVEKNVVRNIFEITTAMFSKKNIKEKMDLYFEDYNFVPLFVYENYTKTSTKNIIELRTMVESISYADIVDRHIHGSSQEWGLLPVHAFFSAIQPSHSRNLNQRIDFPGYLGQLSKRNKNYRNLTEVMHHSFRVISNTRTDFRLYTIDLLFNKIVNCMARGAVEECLDIFKEYEIVQTDFEILTDIVFDGASQVKSIGAKNKGAFTRAYKKMTRKLPYDVSQVKAAIHAEKNDSSE